MKFALITADTSHKTSFRMNPESDDATSFMQWVYLLGGVHLSFEALRKEDNEYLKDFDVVMMSGHLNYIEDISRIANFLKDSPAISMFYPEGSAQLYDNSVNGFHAAYFEAMRACDILSIAEEDKQSYYESLVTEKTLVRFIHVPMTLEMSGSVFYVSRAKKNNSIIVYGDNNPNHPVIALAAIEELSKRQVRDFDVIGVETRNAPFDKVFTNLKIQHHGKQGQYPFLRALGNTIVSFYPTEWIGTARHQISCAVVGTPCIGNRDSHTQMRLFPKLATGIYEVGKMADLASQLITSKNFYEEVTEYALNAVRYYDFGTTANRFFSAVMAAKKKFKNDKAEVMV